MFPIKEQMYEDANFVVNFDGLKVDWFIYL